MVNPTARDRQPSPAFFIAHPPHYSRTEVYHRGHDSLSGLLGLVRLTLREALGSGASQVTEIARRHPRFAFVAVLDSEQPLPLTAVFRSARRLRDVRSVPAWKDGTPSLSDLRSAIWDDSTLHDDLFRWLRAHASVPLPIIATAMEIVWAGYRDPSRIALPDIHARAWRVPPPPRLDGTRQGSSCCKGHPTYSQREHRQNRKRDRASRRREPEPAASTQLRASADVHQAASVMGVAHRRLVHGEGLLEAVGMTETAASGTIWPSLYAAIAAIVG
jgi:hypothetical protein